jgi:mannose-6-phosphate isomerase-like protein (cupin superfamily)
MDTTTTTTTDEMRVKTVWYLGNRMTIHADGADTNGKFGLFESLVKPGSEPPMHMHTREDEYFLVLEGMLRVTVDGKDCTLKPGDSAFVSRLSPHTFKVLTPTARVIGVVTPAGFENFFRTLGDPVVDAVAAESHQIPSFERNREVATRFGTSLIG